MSVEREKARLFLQRIIDRAAVLSVTIPKNTNHKDMGILYVLWSIFAALVGTAIRSSVSYSTVVLTFETDGAEEVQFFELTDEAVSFAGIPSAFFLFFGIFLVLKVLLFLFDGVARVILKLRKIYYSYKKGIPRLKIIDDEEAPSNDTSKPTAPGGPQDPKDPKKRPSATKTDNFIAIVCITCYLILLWAWV